MRTSFLAELLLADPAPGTWGYRCPGPLASVTVNGQFVVVRPVSALGGPVQHLASTGGRLALLLAGVYVVGYAVLWFPAALTVQRYIYAQPPEERPDSLFRWIFVLGAGVVWPLTLPLYVLGRLRRLSGAGRGLVVAGGGMVVVALVGVILAQR